MNIDLLHDAALYLLAALALIALFVAIERAIFLGLAGRSLGRFLHALDEQPIREATRSAAGVAGELVKAYRHARSALGLGVEDAAERAYLALERKLKERIWIIDTVVTAAPLLGLLGTILGIFETFATLAKSGISDPQGVSAGIGAALLATAYGIATALLALFAYNACQSRVERLGEEAKMALLALTPQMAEDMVPAASLASLEATVVHSAPLRATG